MNTRFQVILILSVVSFLTLTFALNSSGQDAPINTRRTPGAEKCLEWQGSYGGLKEPKVMVIRDQDAWQRIYKMISGGNSVPKLDFSRYMVIAVFTGEKMTGGYEVNILRAEEMDGMEIMEHSMGRGGDQVGPLAQIRRKIFVVEYEEVSPGPDSFVTMAITSPYHVKVVRRNDLPVIFVRFEKVTGR